MGTGVKRVPPEPPNSDTNEVRISLRALTALLIFAMGGNGLATYFSTRQEVVRPDPFTGGMAEELEHRLVEKILVNQRTLDIVQRDIKDLERRLNRCEVRTNYDE